MIVFLSGAAMASLVWTMVYHPGGESPAQRTHRKEMPVPGALSNSLLPQIHALQQSSARGGIPPQTPIAITPGIPKMPEAAQSEAIAEDGDETPAPGLVEDAPMPGGFVENPPIPGGIVENAPMPGGSVGNSAINANDEPSGVASGG